MSRDGARGPRRGYVGLAGAGLLLGAAAGWVAGLLRAPRGKRTKP